MVGSVFTAKLRPGRSAQLPKLILEGGLCPLTLEQEMDALGNHLQLNMRGLELFVFFSFK